LSRHHLAGSARASSPLGAARDLVALHGTDPASVYLALRARLKRPDLKLIEQALYEDRHLIRMLGMRRTVFVVPAELMPFIQASCTDAIAKRNRQLYVREFGKAGIKDPERWVKQVEKDTFKALQRRGHATGMELAKDVPALRTKIVLAEGKTYSAEVNVTTRILFQMAADGLIVRGRPRGTWISGQFEWWPLKDWLDVESKPPATAEAEAELVRRWLRSFGPGTTADIAWWTGWTVGSVKRALAAVGATEVELDDGPGWLLADDLETTRTPKPSVNFLPALDPTAMGWSKRDWFLPSKHVSQLFDRSGNVGPTIWVDGQVVGGWAQRASGEVAIRLLEDMGRQAKSAVEDGAERLRDWIGGVRVTPRFRTPLERELSSA
jgi:hypothetical protein